jgi:hypothetical protein
LNCTGLLNKVLCICACILGLAHSCSYAAFTLQLHE